LIPLTLIDIVGVSILLGIVQGISEWLPISSKTQVLLVSTILLGLTFSQGYALGLFLEGGTVLAAIYYFRGEVWEVLKSIVGKGSHDGRMLLKYLVVATAITAVLGVLIYKFITMFVTGSVIGIPMILLGALLLVDWILIKTSSKHKNPHKELKNLTLKEMIYVGFAQGISALPGVSRSGVTTSTMLFEGVKPDEAFRLSFILGIPATIGASAVTILFSRASISSTVSYITPLGILIATVVGLLVSLFLIRKLIRFASHNTMSKLLFLLGIIAIASGIVVILTGLG
jgi:undecaprenyl-diphosphatase